MKLSSGKLHSMITEGKESIHQEKDEILEVGLRVSSHIHADDTGARHQGKNGYTPHIGNEMFAWFETTHSKSRFNFLALLRCGRTDYVYVVRPSSTWLRRNCRRSRLPSLPRWAMLPLPTASSGRLPSLVLVLPTSGMFE